MSLLEIIIKNLHILNNYYIFLISIRFNDEFPSVSLSKESFMASIIVYPSFLILFIKILYFFLSN